VLTLLGKSINAFTSFNQLGIWGWRQWNLRMDLAQQSQNDRPDLANFASIISPPLQELPRRERYYQRLLKEAAIHPAMNHIWLQNVSNQTYGNMNVVFAEFAREYHGYCASFADYLGGVIHVLENEDHKDIFKCRLLEQSGQVEPTDCDSLKDIGIDPDEVNGIPRPELFRRFCYAMGLTRHNLKHISVAAMRWRWQFLMFLAKASPAAAVGALGLGTEYVAQHTYKEMVSTLRDLSTVNREDCVFFELHCIGNDEDEGKLQEVSLSLLNDEDDYHEMRRGMLAALELRNQFFNHLHQRASIISRGTPA